MAKKAKKATRDRGGEALKRSAKRTLKTIRKVFSGPIPPTHATAPDVPADTITLERLGDVKTWKIPAAPYAGDKNGRAAFIGGFRSRTEQWQGQGELKPEQRFATVKLQSAFEDGYHEAARQDGGHLKPRTLKAGK